MPALILDFAGVPVGDDRYDGSAEIEFDGPSGGWLITRIWELGPTGREIELNHRFTPFRDVRKALYVHRGDEIADAVREAREVETVRSRPMTMLEVAR